MEHPILLDCLKAEIDESNGQGIFSHMMNDNIVQKEPMIPIQMTKDMN